MDEKKELYDVVICGAGPTGLLIAYYLCRAGLKVFVAEKLDPAAQSTYGRATTLFQRTLEMLDQIDLYEELAQTGVIMRTTNNWDKHGHREPSRGWQGMFSKIEPTHFDFAMNIRQRYSEEVFRKALKANGGKVSTGIAIDSFTVHETGDYSAHPVEVVIKDVKSDAKKVVFCKSLIGADGAHSTIRRVADIPFEGDTTARKWVRIDGVLETNFPESRSGSAAIESPTHGNVLYVNLDHGASRIGFALTDKLASKYGEKLTEEEAVYEAQQAMKPFEVEFQQVDWFTTYGIGQRIAASFSKDRRIFLVGDAAHTHSSAMAQGMNTGVHDAINLSWKLAGVLNGVYDPAILDTYEAERRPVAQQLIANDRKISKLISGELSVDGRDTNELMAEFVRASGSFGVGLGISYGLSMVNASKVTAGILSTGQRGPDALLRRTGIRVPVRLHETLKNDVKFHILVFTGQPYKTSPDLQVVGKFVTASSVMGHQLNFMTIIPGFGNSVYETLNGADAVGKVMWDPDWNAYTAYGITEEGGIVVLRPDGYVGAAEGLNESGVRGIERYLKAFLLKFDV